MNTYAKGRRVELKAKRELESVGYIVAQARINRFGGNDFFGIIDLIAVLPEKHVKWIQVKSNRVSRKTKVEMVKFGFMLPHEAPTTNLPEIWVWKDRKGFEIFSFLNEGCRCLECGKIMVSQKEGEKHPCHVKWLKGMNHGV